GNDVRSELDAGKPEGGDVLDRLAVVAAPGDGRISEPDGLSAAVRPPGHGRSRPEAGGGRPDEIAPLHRAPLPNPPTRLHSERPVKGAVQQEGSTMLVRRCIMLEAALLAAVSAGAQVKVDKVACFDQP